MLKAGDFIQCKKSEMVQYSLDLNEMGIYNDFVFEPVPGIQIMGPWLDPEVEPPREGWHLPFRAGQRQGKKRSHLRRDACDRGVLAR